MAPVRFIAALLLVLACAAPAPAQSGEDAAFTALRDDFARLFHAIESGRGITDSDRPALRRMLDRVDAFREEHPANAGGAAMALQLALWLGDADRVPDLYDTLAALRPTDAAIAESRLRWMESKGDLTPEQMMEDYRDLHKRFPTSIPVAEGLAKRLKDQARYEEAISVLRAANPTVEDAPQAMYTLAECLFADQHFEEAQDVLEQLVAAGITEFRLRSDIERLLTTTKDYVDLWKKEQEIRAAEAEADDLPRVELETSKGRIVLELFENEAPNTVANFISLAEKGFYDGTRFHRWEPDFMIQGGDPLSREGATGVPGTGDPGYFIPDEHLLPEHRNHFRDSVAMAKTSRPNSAGCQFYLNHRPTPWLNGQHTVFGRVIEGLDVARSLRRDDELIKVTVLRKRDHAYEPNTIPK